MGFSRIGVVLLCVSAIGCTTSPDLPSTSNNVLAVLEPGEQVKANQVSQKRDRVVQVQGQIKAQAPLMGGQRAYEVQDETGSVWVVSDRTVPATGSRVSVQGRVKFQKIEIGGKDQSSVYIEQQ
ncbi:MULTISPECIES: hypothetical protein [Leptolyngbya]|uniref:hypothetical protein n=1 Tax=Leptolyngbya TaxID=47251 RepID=UPI0016839A5B|nr:hypothetical protein [Leptolyngbya sp. FACHB-1624]MBD1859014.1 hypothetical protein [Leptolyngbya sp. FACHB-1624]